MHVHLCVSMYVVYSCLLCVYMCMCIHMWCVCVYVCGIYMCSVCTVWHVHVYEWYVCVYVLRREMLVIILEKTEPRCARKKMLYFSLSSAFKK